MYHFHQFSSLYLLHRDRTIIIGGITCYQHERTNKLVNTKKYGEEEKASKEEIDIKEESGGEEAEVTSKKSCEENGQRNEKAATSFDELCHC